MYDMVYMITGIVPYDGDRVTIAVYLNKDKAIKRYNKELMEQYYVTFRSTNTKLMVNYA